MTTDENWIEQGSETSYTKHKGLDGKIVITTSQATIIELDGSSSIRKLLIDTGNRGVVDQIESEKTKLIDPAGDTLELDDVPALDAQVLITNITKAG